ncbi:MAG: NAD-dependent epimerase/dehydratase family protein [Candidatus Bathyarchaeia archaeon]
MRILVTGAAGFIGKHLVRRLMVDRHEVIAFDRRSCSLGTQSVQGDVASFDFSNILEDVDVVFHLASLLGTAELFHKIIEAERVNVIGTLNLLEAMRKKDVDTIVFTSKPNFWKDNVYTITKETCERYLTMYRNVYGFNAVLARPFNVYGPEEYLSEYRKAIPYFVTAALKNETIEIFGNGEQTMDAIYVDDAIEALVRCSIVRPKEVVEIGNGKPVKVKYLAEKTIDLSNSKSKLLYIPMRRGEADAKDVHSNGNIERLIGFLPKIRLEDGLKRTIDWYSKHLQEFDNIYKFKEEDFQT